MDTIVEPLQNVIVTSSLPPSNAASIRPYPSPPPQLTDDMSAPFVPQEFQFPAHQPPPQPFVPAHHHQPIQRPHSVGNAPSTSSTPSPFNMDAMQRNLPVPGPGYSPQALPVAGQLPLQPSRHPHHMQQGPHPSTHAPAYSKPRFQTGPSPAAVAYQISQQIQQYQGGLGGGPPADMYNHSYQQSPTYYTYGQQSYTTFHPDPQGEVLFQVPFSANYPPPSYPVAPGPGNVPNHVGQTWYPPPQQQNQQHQQQQPPTQYYYAPPMNYVQQPLQMPQGPVGHLQPYPVAPEQPRRHSVPRRKRGPEPDGAGHPGGYHLSPAVRGAAASSSKSTPNIGSATPTHPSSPSVPRGPPRKPKQTGYALWVGNLPLSADVAALKDHFSLCFGHELESVRLIPKSNCGFVNYRTEAARDQAMLRFNNAKFKGTRLVCRLRPRGPAAPAANAADSLTPSPPDASGQASGDEGCAAIDAAAETQDQTASALEVGRAPPTGPSGARVPRTNAKFRYFILKSLTVEDLELSQKNGVWATQSHNEAALNQAFEAAESVFLIFSANKSGEYYGYARMTSKITNDLSNKISTTELPSQTPVQKSHSEQVESDAELPKAIYTAATETARKGRIIDDSARDCIFWEALSDGDEESDEDGSEIGKVVSKVWGRPFRVEWLCTSRLPFHRTRGIRNSLNGGRDVKIARDGTELEEHAGRRLLQMFHQWGMP